MSEYEENDSERHNVKFYDIIIKLSEQNKNAEKIQHIIKRRYNEDISQDYILSIIDDYEYNDFL